MRWKSADIVLDASGRSHISKPRIHTPRAAHVTGSTLKVASPGRFKTEAQSAHGERPVREHCAVHAVHAMHTHGPKHLPARPPVVSLSRERSAGYRCRVHSPNDTRAKTHTQGASRSQDKSKPTSGQAQDRLNTNQRNKLRGKPDTHSGDKLKT